MEQVHHPKLPDATPEEGDVVGYHKKDLSFVKTLQDVRPEAVDRPETRGSEHTTDKIIKEMREEKTFNGKTVLIK
ncbi:hypothetical protein RUM43_009886 [Polyplax serrata]|uniref:Uncharacterized protein n=1 Tax=Polyplax serrata TaxID=468196 RepID=A0AAN8NZK7_POLSC